MRSLPAELELDEKFGVLVESADIDGQHDEADKVGKNDKEKLQFYCDEGVRRFALSDAIQV